MTTPSFHDSTSELQADGLLPCPFCGSPAVHCSTSAHDMLIVLRSIHAVIRIPAEK